MSDPITLQQAIGLDNFFFQPLLRLESNRKERRQHMAVQLKQLRHFLNARGLACLRFAALRSNNRKLIPQELFIRNLAQVCPVWRRMLIAKTAEEVHWHQIEPWLFCEPNREWRKLGYRLVRAVKLNTRKGTWRTGYCVIHMEYRTFVEASSHREALKIYFGPRQIKDHRKLAHFVRNARDISFKDATRAGFCIEGTAAWCENNKIYIEDGVIPARALIPHLQDKLARRVVDVLLHDAGRRL